MKKHLLILICLITTVQLGFSQNDRMTKSTGKNHEAPTSSLKKGFAPKSQTTIWTDDFSNVNNWDISNQVGNSDDWVIGTGVPSGAFLIPGILSTTAANGFALYDSDLLCSGDQIADLTTANSINCSGNSSVFLSFEQYYRRFDDSTIVFVSLDNVNWTAFPLNTTVLNNGYCTGGTANVNPDLVSIDISSVAANQPTVWIRFEFYSPSTFVGPGAAPGCGYSWMIDDVSLFEPAATGINEATNVGGVKLFPNPAESVLAIQVKKYDNATVRIFDITGNEIYTAALNEMNTTVDVSNYASGLYLVKVEGQDFSYSEKLTVK